MLGGRGAAHRGVMPTVTAMVPFEVGGKAAAALVEGAALKVPPSAPHGITETHKEQLNADLLGFVQGVAAGSTSSVMAVANRF